VDAAVERDVVAIHRLAELRPEFRPGLGAEELHQPFGLGDQKPSPLPPNQTSKVGLAFSARSRARADPELRRTKSSPVPVLLNSRLIASHQAGSGLQTTTTLFSPAQAGSVQRNARPIANRTNAPVRFMASPPFSSRDARHEHPNRQNPLPKRAALHQDLVQVREDRWIASTYFCISSSDCGNSGKVWEPTTSESSSSFMVSGYSARSYFTSSPSGHCQGHPKP